LFFNVADILIIYTVMGNICTVVTFTTVNRNCNCESIWKIEGKFNENVPSQISKLLTYFLMFSDNDELHYIVDLPF